MLHSSRFIAILDACVLYPAPLRDLLMEIGVVGLYTPKWSDKIIEEWTRNLLKNRPNLTPAMLQHTINCMNGAFLEVLVPAHEEIATGLSLPDSNDNHVLASAIVSRADVIVTFNIKDFPPDYLSTYGVEVMHPDEFLLNLIDIDKKLAMQAIVNISTRLKAPPKTVAEILETLSNNDIPLASQELKALFGIA